MGTDEDGATFLPGEQSLLDRVGPQVPAHLEALAGDYLPSARLLARRTAELHLALGDGAGHAGLETVSYTREYRQAIYEAKRGLTGQAFGPLRNKVPRICRTSQEPRQRVSCRSRGRSRLARAIPRAQHLGFQNAGAWRLPPEPGSLHRQRFCYN